jgi:hypothetical protein
MNMSAWRTKTWLRLKALAHRGAFDRDLEDEIAFHLAMRERKQQSLGLSADAARYNTRRRFGNVALIKEDTREMRTFTLLETFWQLCGTDAAQESRVPGCGGPFTGARNWGQ